MSPVPKSLPSGFLRRSARIASFLAIALIHSSCGGKGSSNAPNISIALAPSDAVLHTGESRTFNATVSGSANLSVDWKVEEGAAGGSVSTDGLYTAPQSTGIYHLIAASRADVTKTARAVITVNPPAGTLDAGFGSQGKLSAPMNSDSDLGVTLAFQPDGKVIVAGYRNNGFNDDFTLARYLPDGSPDTVFGTGGKVITPVGFQ